MARTDFKSRINDMYRHLAHKKASRVPHVLITSNSSSSGEELTLKYQDSLPKFPVPPLHQTLEKYLRQYQPYVSREEYERTKKVVEEFGRSGGTGELLQQKLEQRGENRENWLSEWWRNSFLKHRFPNVLYTAAGSLMQQLPFKGLDEQIEYMSFGIAAIASAISLIARHQFPPAKVKGKPLCMDQYYKTICSCRVPGRPMDSISYHPVDHPDAPRHIVIMRKNHFFKFDILDEHKVPISPTSVRKQLKHIFRESQEPAIPVGLLTSLDRDTWADLYGELKAVPTNAQSLLDIQSSTLVVCLDETKDFSDASVKNRYDLRWGMCGGGSTESSGNRWFDKPFMIYAGTHGECGVYGDHTVADGILVTKVYAGTNGEFGIYGDHTVPDGVLISGLASYTAKYMKNLSSGTHEEGFNPKSLAPPEKLLFCLSDDLLQAVEDAGHHIDRILDSFQIELRKFRFFGKTLLKRYGLHPDGCVQIALQLAYWRMFGRLPVVYEASSSHGFKLGRVDHLRAVTVESAEFVRSVDDRNSKSSEKFAKLKLALRVHVRNIGEVKQGNGTEKHLFGLYNIAGENHIDASEFFEDPSWKKMSEIDFRSATLPGSLIRASLAPVRYQPNTTGLWYSITEDNISICMNNAEREPTLDLDQFMDALHLSLMDIKDVAQGALGEASKL